MSITLDAIRAAADAKYGSYDIVLSDPTNPVRLLNPLRLSEQNRAALLDLQKSMKDEDDDRDQSVIFAEMIRIVAETPGQADALLAAVGSDLGVLATIVTNYSEGTQVGEA